MTDRPTQIELDAYIDDELDAEGRYSVESYLAQRPAQAARMMDDLSTRSALRLLSRRNRHRAASPEKAEAVSGLRPRWPRIIALGVGVLALTGIGANFVANADEPPRYVDYALESHRVAMLRATMDSQLESPDYDINEIARSTRIAVPQLPADWRITDAQVFPTTQGPALMIAVRTAQNKTMTIFAMHQLSDAPTRPESIREGRQSVAYWQQGDMAFALTGDTTPRDIDVSAEWLAQSWS